MKILRDQGIDVDGIVSTSRRNSAERGRKLADQLAHSVLPLFIEDYQGRPDRIGSCVLVRPDSGAYAFTAGHVLEDAGSSQLFASPGPTVKLMPLPYTAAHSARKGPSGLDLDVGVLPLDEGALGPFAQCGFLTGDEIDENDTADFNGFLEFYYVFGYPAARTQVKISHSLRHIKQRSFQLSTTPPEAEAYVRENISSSDHILLEFDHKDTVVEGRIVAPPKLQGLSGGAILRINRTTLERRLVAIAVEHRKSSRFIVGTRIKHFLNLAREA